MNDGNDLQPWRPRQWPELPHRVRDNEEAIASMSEDMDELNRTMKRAMYGIWALVLQLAGAAITYWMGG